MNARDSLFSGHYNVDDILSLKGTKIQRSAKEQRNVKRASGMLVNGANARL